MLEALLLADDETVAVQVAPTYVLVLQTVTSVNLQICVHVREELALADGH